ncbi:MAG TPA: response regulator [Bryobacteraceae bacterium]|nr:response regulator [Bryobacteraceae bacterium]
MERADLDQWRGREVARLLALVETQRRYYQEIVASIPVGLLVLSSDLTILLANTTARRIFGLQTGESPRRMDTVLPASLLDRIEDVLKSGGRQNGIVLQHGRDNRRLRVGILAIRSWDEEAAEEALLTVEDLTGLEVPMEAAAEAPVAELPEVQAPAVPSEDAPVTAPAEEVAPAEAAAAISAAQLVDNIDAIVWAVELPSMNFVFASPQAAKLLGFAPEHWTSHPSFWLDRVHDSDRDWVSRSYQRAVEHGTSLSCEFRAITAGGGSIWLREHARLLPGADGEPRYLIGIAVDVTERRMLEDQLVQSERVEAVSRLASRMAHDLNNMLMILTGYSEELLTNLPAGSSLRADVQEILAATDRMSGLTSLLLSFSRRQPGAVTEMDLESTLGRFSPRWSALLGSNISIELRPSAEPSRIRADFAQLEQVITAIVERARQGMHAGEKITVETSRVEVSEDLRRPNAPLQPGAYVVISIVAPGQPIDLEAKTAMFECSLPGKEPWDDVAATLSRAYGILRQWGGDISVAGGPRGTTVFHVFLPRVEMPAGEAIVEQAAPVEAAAAVESAARLATILVVEDEAGIRALVRKILRRQGYEVLEAANGQEALTLCRDHAQRVNLLITDVLMPQMGGRELVERLQTQGHEMKVLYVSGYTDDATVYSGDLPPGTAFLQKPFTLGSLLDKVKEVLGQ